MTVGVNYRLTVRQGPIPGKVIELGKEIMVIGRDVNNDIVVNDAEVSRTHTRLTLQGDGYLAEDLASTNGTFVNGQRLTGPRLLRPGDMLGMGETVVLEFGVVRSTEATIVSSGPLFTPPPPAAPAPGVDNPPPPPVEAAPPFTPTFTPAEPEAAPSLMYNPSSDAGAAVPPPFAPAPTPFTPAAEPSVPEIARPKKDNRMLMIGGGCGCLTLCACASVAAALYYAYQSGVFQSLGF